mgnify:FL=1
MSNLKIDVEHLNHLFSLNDETADLEAEVSIGSIDGAVDVWCTTTGTPQGTFDDIHEALYAFVPEDLY